MGSWAVLFVAATCIQTVYTARILALCTVASPSHSIWCYSYMAALAESGHQITVFGVDEPKFKIANLTTYIATGVYEASFTSESISEVTGGLLPGKISNLYPGFVTWNKASSKALLHSTALKRLINDHKGIEKPFDLIIQDNINADAILGLVPLFGNPPLILATTFGCAQWMNFRVGNVFNPAYVPSMISTPNQHMSFLERCENTFYYIFLEWLTKCVIAPFQDELMREVFGKHLPPVNDIAKLANVIIVNHHIALNDPRPMLPGVVGIAGLHIRDPNPLPKDIKQFMDEAEHGVILFSLGSNVDSSWLPPDFEEVVVNALRQLPQKVLWKWNKEVSDTPGNTKISKWLPQSDILAHPNIRLFISHCGLLSVQEAIMRKVPILALPVFSDQFENAEMLLSRNLTIQLDVYKLKAHELQAGIDGILKNPMYKTKIEQLGDLMVDMPQTAKQQAVFWTEYVIRDKGAPHLRSAAADMPWHQLLLLDVIGFFLLLLIIFLWLFIYFVMFIVKRINKIVIKQKTE